MNATSEDLRCSVTYERGHEKVKVVEFRIDAAREMCERGEALCCDENLCCWTIKKDAVVFVNCSNSGEVERSEESGTSVWTTFSEDEV